MGNTVWPPIVGGSGPAPHERVFSPSQPPAAPALKKPCTCGTPVECTAHD
jgi:hypothetical protein